MIHTSKTNARALRVHNMLRRGASRQQAATALGVSLQYIHWLEKRGKRVGEDIVTKNPAGELSERIRNALDLDGCDPITPENVRAHIKTRYDILVMPNIGEKSRAELNAWLIKHGQEPIS